MVNIVIGLNDIFLGYFDDYLLLSSIHHRFVDNHQDSDWLDDYLLWFGGS